MKTRATKPVPPDSSAPDDRATAYARAVIDRRIVAGPQVRKACERHLADLVHGAERGLRFDPAKAAHVIDYFEEVLCLNGGDFEGKPFLLQPWQSFIIGSVFGWLRQDGSRRFRVAFVLIGKGNGKTPLAAGVGMYCLTADGESRAEVYAAAAKKDQAMILFADACAMRDQSPELRRRLRKWGGERPSNMSYLPTASFFRVISSDNKKSGARPHCSLIDEIHEHPNGIVVNMLRMGVKGRRQPITFEITNAGSDRTSICYDHAEHSKRIVQGETVDDEWFAYVCELDEGDDPHDLETGPACWIKANPNLGVSIKPSYIRSQVADARNLPSQKSEVDRLTFCTWTDSVAPWIDSDLWMACEKQFDALEYLRECDDVTAALDLSQTSDLTALALSGKVQTAEGERIVGKVEYWTPKATIKARSRKDRVTYDLWADQGYMHTTPGRHVDYRFIGERIAELQQLLPNLKRLVFDPYRMRYLIDVFDEMGIEIELVEHPQGYYQRKESAKNQYGEPLPFLWMPRSVDLIERAVADGAIDVEFNPVLRWNSSSAMLRADQKNNRIFDKKISRGRIDGIVALTMSLGVTAETVERESNDGAFSSPIIVA